MLKKKKKPSLKLITTEAKLLSWILSWIRWVDPILPTQITSSLDNKLQEISIQENEPIVVVMNPEGDVVNENALNMIQLVGMEAFPFTRHIRGYNTITVQGLCM
jgi:hypothetical protein